MILARNSITLHHLRDITTVVWYYKLQASTASPPAKPTTAAPSGWTTTEPSYTEGSTNSLYVCQKTTFSDGSFEYSDVSLSSSYEAAKAAYNKSVQAKEAADTALQQSVWYAICETAAGTTAKVATITPATTDFVLQAGAVVNVKFDNTNSGAVGSLTLNVNGTGAKPLKYINNGGAPGNIAGAGYLRANNVYQFIYDGTNWIVQLNYNTNTVGIYGGTVKAGANGVKQYSLIMRDTEDTWTSLTTTAGTGTSKARYTGGLNPDKLLYMGSSSSYAAGASTGTCYDASAIDFRYSSNCGSTLEIGKPVYLVGTLTNGLFYLYGTWWTQTLPTAENGKTYVYVGIAYSAYQVYLTAENPLYQFYDGKFRTLREIEELKAAKTADNYLSADNTGIMVADMTDGNQYTPSTVPSGVKNTFIDEDSFQVRDGTDVLASFGEESRIGKEDKNHLDINATGIQGVNPDGANFFNVDMDGAVTDALISPNTRIVSISGVSADNSKTATVSLEPFSMANKTVKLHIWSLTRPTGSQQYTAFNDDFIFEYGTDASFHNIYGAYSVRVTYSASADTVTIQGSAFMGTGGFVGSSDVSLVSYYRATYAPAFYFGSRADYNPGGFSATLGESLSASTRDQFACGRYNTDDPDYAFMVGNGSEIDGESNAFAVTWDGNQLMALDETATSGTDADLYSAITALGWESEVLV